MPEWKSTLQNCEANWPRPTKVFAAASQPRDTSNKRTRGPFLLEGHKRTRGLKMGVASEGLALC
jgi:hypothetical protein